MKNHDSRAEYEARLHRALNYIDRRLDQALNLERIAKVACFSPYHFHRLFTAMMGETLGDYARRRRLEIAAVSLVTQPRAAIPDIALSVCFGSAEAFSHAFKSRFGVSPTGWRTQEQVHQSKANQVDRKTDQVRCTAVAQVGSTRKQKPEAAMKVVVVDRSPTLVACLRHVGPYGQPVNHFWQTKVYPWMVSNKLLDQPRYGVSHDDPGITEPSKCRSDAGVEVKPGFKSNGPSFTTTLPGGALPAPNSMAREPTS
jgi:AraC family transcriptional regulator